MDHDFDVVLANLNQRLGCGRGFACCPAVLQPTSAFAAVAFAAVAFAAVAFAAVAFAAVAFAAFFFVFYVVHLNRNCSSGNHIMQEYILASISPRLRQAREQAGVTLAQLAERTSYAVTTLSGVENGHDQPSKRLLSRWIQALAINESWLKTGDGEVFAKAVPKQVPEQRSDLAAPIRFRIQKARQHATDLLQELGQIERDLSGSKPLPSPRKRP